MEQEKKTSWSDRFTFADFYESQDADIFKKAEALQKFIDDWARMGGYTYRRPALSPVGNRVWISDPHTRKKREMVMMASNNYLGLESHPKLIEAALIALQQYGTGATGSPMLTGTTELHLKLEEKLAHIKKQGGALLFPSGYAANVGTIQGLSRGSDAVIRDELAHASIIDGCKLSGAKHLSFRHNDVHHLEEVLRDLDTNMLGKLVLVEGIYSMDGDIAPLPDILSVCKKYGAKLMVDEAHAMGVLGKNGYGSVEHFDLEEEVDIVMGTFSKALCHLGGFITSTREVTSYVRHYGRSTFFSTSLPPVIVAGVLAALDVVKEDAKRRMRLWENISYLKKGLKNAGFEIPESSNSPIIPIIIGNEARMRHMARRIHEEGIYLNPVPFPAVQMNKTRFRLSVMATHTKEDLDKTISALTKVSDEFGFFGKNG